MKKILFSLFFGIITFNGSVCNVFALADGGPLPWLPWEQDLEANGYTCTYYNHQHIETALSPSNSGTIDCVKTTTSGYTGRIDGPKTVTGLANTTTDTQTTSWSNSPFLYFSNPPQGTISVSLNSKLNSYFPKPTFNSKNGWDLIGDSKKGSVYLDDKEQKHLFYELAMNSITLNRNGQNFKSKENLTSFLNNSNFFDKLGFSKEQKENSLKYVLQKLNETKDSKYYYLTVLDESSIRDISKLDIQPKPNKIIRSYFAIYPSDVPVKTTGGFVFPKIEKESGFTVKETGELLIPNDMTVFFK